MFCLRKMKILHKLTEVIKIGINKMKLKICSESEKVISKF